MSRDISKITTYESGIMQSTAHRILNRINTDFLSRYGLTPSQWFVIGLAYKEGAGGIRLHDLQKKLDTTMPFITNMVNILESKGILHKETHPEDNRVKLAVINESYYATIDEIEQNLREEWRSTLYSEDNITREELSNYINVLYKIAQSNK